MRVSRLRNIVANHVDAFLLTAGIVWLLVWITLIGLMFV